MTRSKNNCSDFFADVGRFEFNKFVGCKKYNVSHNILYVRARDDLLIVALVFLCQ